MIALYHGGVEAISSPEIRQANRTLDFGRGFYLTSSLKQAEDWVRRRLERGEAEQGTVSKYLCKISDLQKYLTVKIFTAPNDEWLDFVMANRMTRDFEHSYDLVVGPVANDRVYTAFSLYEGGTISRDTLIRELKTYRLVDQYLFHTEASLGYLKFVDSLSVEL